MDPVFIAICLSSRERHSVIAGNYYNSIIQLTFLFQVFEHSSQVKVEPFNFHRIIEQVTPYNFIIRKVFGYINIIRAFTIPFPGILFIGSVGFGCSIPEEEWFVAPDVFHKIFKVLKIINSAYTASGALITGRSGLITYIAVGYTSGICSPP